MLLRFLVIVILVGFLLFKVLGLVFRLLGGSATSRTQGKNYQNQYQTNSGKSAGNNINIDYVPKNGKKAPKAFKGGEYVDYEEIE